MERPIVFVSHSHLDNEITDRIVADLQNAGAVVWWDRSGIQHGDFVEQINDALSQSDWVVLVQTPNSLQSKVVQQEINAALNMKHHGRIRDVIPFVVAPFSRDDVPPLWSTLHYYDATRGYENALHDLLVALGLARPNVSSALRLDPYTALAHPQPRPQPKRAKRVPIARPPVNVPWIVSKEALILVSVAAYFSIIVGFVVYGTAGCDGASDGYCIPAHPGFDVSMGLWIIGFTLFILACVLTIVKMCIARQWLWLVVAFLIWPVGPLVYAFASPPDVSKSLVAPLAARLRVTGLLRPLRKVAARKHAVLIVGLGSQVCCLVGIGAADASSQCGLGGTGSQVCAHSEPGNTIAAILIVLFIVLYLVAWLLGVIKTIRIQRWGWLVLVFFVPLGNVIYGIFGPEK